MIKEIENIESNDLKDIVFGMELIYSEIEYILDVRCNATTSIGYTLPFGLYEHSDNILMLKSLLPDEVRVDITIHDIRSTSNIKKKQNKKVFQKMFFHLYFWVSLNQIQNH